MQYDVIIVGGGPAGLTAALYASRRSLKTLVLTRDIGGQAAKTFDIENYPGIIFATGIELTEIFKKQAENFGAEIKFEETKKITPEKNIFKIETLNNVYEAKTIILAFGKQPRELNVEGEQEFQGRGVSYCATCDMPFFKNKTVAIVGGGNSALDAALLAAKNCEKVYLIHRRDEFRAENILIEKAKNSKNIEIILNSNIQKIKGKNVVESIIIESGKEINVSGVFAEIGYVVDRSLVENLVELNDKNQVIVDSNQNTSIPGIFAAGDLTTTIYKQIVISAGEGAKAALSVYDYIQKNEGKTGIAGDWGKK